MNQFFSFKRFNLLVLKHWADNKKRYTLSLLALFGLLIACFVLMLVAEEQPLTRGTREATYFLFLFPAGTFYASLYFRDLASASKGSNFLLVPASSFEKLLCSILYTVLLFFVAFTAAFYLVDILMISISNNIFPVSGKEPPVNIFDITAIKFSSGMGISLLAFFFAVQSIFLFGAVYFRKYSFLKTIISGFVIFFVLFCLAYFVFHRLYPDVEAFHLVSDRTVQIISFIIVYATAPLLWTASYYRLKRKQVAL